MSKTYTNIIMKLLRYQTFDPMRVLPNFLFHDTKFEGISRQMLTCKDFTFLLLVYSMLVKTRTTRRDLPDIFFESSSKYQQADRNLFLMHINSDPDEPLATVLERGIDILKQERNEDQDWKVCMFALTVNLQKANVNRILSRNDRWLLESAQYREMLGIAQKTVENSVAIIYKFKKGYPNGNIDGLDFLRGDNSIYGIIAQIITKRSQGMEYNHEELEYHKMMVTITANDQAKSTMGSTLSYTRKIWNPNFPFYYSLNFGDWIEVKWGNCYYYARALYYHVDVNGQVRLRIHYAGWPRSDDADIALNDDTIRPYDPTETLKDDLVKPRKQDPESHYRKSGKIPGISSSTVAAQIRDRGYGVLISDQPFSEVENTESKKMVKGGKYIVL